MKITSSWVNVYLRILKGIFAICKYILVVCGTCETFGSFYEIFTFSFIKMVKVGYLLGCVLGFQVGGCVGVPGGYLLDSIPEGNVSIPEMLDIPVFESNVVYQWGRDRIDQESRLQSSQEGVGMYRPANSGSGVWVYVLDTGCVKDHVEYKNRVVWGKSFWGADSDDRHGHGTHVVSTVLGKKVGVARGARGVCVKVLNDSGGGTWDTVVRGIEWSVNDIKSKRRCGIVSMSLGGGYSDIINDIINSTVGLGIPVVVSSGNRGSGDCDSSPASAELAITVGSVNRNDQMSGYSNYGSCVDIFAPGDNIVGAGLGRDRYVSRSGTSMSTPHVSGALALYLSSNGCNVTGISGYLKTLRNKIKGIPIKTKTPNRLVQVYSIPTNCTIFCKGIKRCECKNSLYMYNTSCECVYKKRVCSYLGK